MALYCVTVTSVTVSNFSCSFKCIESGPRSVSTKASSTSAVFMWWELKMDPARKITLSCAPHWAHPNGGESKPSSSLGFSHDDKNVPWRDHWMQSVYYPVSGDLQASSNNPI